MYDQSRLEACILHMLTVHDRILGDVPAKIYSTYTDMYGFGKPYVRRTMLRRTSRKRW